MDIKKVIQELHEELARIDEAILTLERLRQGTRRRGRPPNWLTLSEPSSGNSRKKVKRKAERRAARP